jgi:putative redox protein
MKSTVTWKEGMRFEAECGGNSLSIDAKPPHGKNEGFTPKELVALGIAGCTGIDIVSLLRKNKQPLKSLVVETNVTQTQGTQPTVFSRVELLFRLEGDVQTAAALEAVELSQTKYCGVSAMISLAAPIHYVVELNGSRIGEGEAKFSLPPRA